MSRLLCEQRDKVAAECVAKWKIRCVVWVWRRKVRRLSENKMTDEILYVQFWQSRWKRTIKSPEKCRISKQNKRSNQSANNNNIVRLNSEIVQVKIEGERFSNWWRTLVRNYYVCVCAVMFMTVRRKWQWNKTMSFVMVDIVVWREQWPAWVNNNAFIE